MTAPPASLGAAVNATLPDAVLRMPLTRADGSTTTLSAYRGKVVMIADFMTLCEDVCPLITANTVAMGRALEANGTASHVALLEITLDPHRDTPRRMQAYAKLYGARAPADWTLLRASPSNTMRLWRYFGVYDHRVIEGTPADTDWLTGNPLTYDVDHSDDVIFLDTSGRERFVIDGTPDTQGERPPSSLMRFLSSEGRRDLTHPDPAEDWTVAQGLRVIDWLTGLASG